MMIFLCQVQIGTIDFLVVSFNINVIVIVYSDPNGTNFFMDMQNDLNIVSYNSPHAFILRGKLTVWYYCTVANPASNSWSSTAHLVALS